MKSCGKELESETHVNMMDHFPTQIFDEKNYVYKYSNGVQ